LRILAGIAEEAGRPLGFRTPAQVRAEMEQLGPWDGARATLAEPPTRLTRKAPETGLALATWKQLIDNGSLQDGDDNLRATARRPVARVSAETAEMLKGDLNGDLVTLTGDRGAVTLPIEVADVAEGTVWVPANSFGNGVLADLASPGSSVSVTPVSLPVSVEEGQR